MSLPARPLSARFHEKYIVDEETGCWLWQAQITSLGYGRIRVGTQPCYAHRVSYELHRGQIPEGLEIDHLCRVRRCVNPDHLELVTRLENVRRGTRGGMGAINAAKTHCPKGHPYDEANTAYRRKPSGAVSRRCRTCERAHRLARAAHKRAAMSGPRPMLHLELDDDQDRRENEA